MSEQLSLLVPKFPEGLRYEPNFVGSGAAENLIAELRQLDLAQFQFGQWEGKRRVAWFGWKYDYDERKIQRASDVPDWLQPLASKIERFDDLEPGSIAQVLITEYEAGAGIGWHRDKPHFERILGLSLASPCKFRFRRKNGAKWERFSFDAEPRSLYRMVEEARHGWEHSIPPVERLRYSITFRTMSR